MAHFKTSVGSYRYHCLLKSEIKKLEGKDWAAPRPASDLRNTRRMARKKHNITGGGIAFAFNACREPQDREKEIDAEADAFSR